MARQKRIQKKGLHYISNRSVELRNAFIVKEDYIAFIDALCKLSKFNKFSIHSYVLLPHAYHLLIETTKENLSAIMKFLNSEYSRYFNKRYGRNGALWEGRFKSSFMKDISYAFYFIAYMENLPKMTGITAQLRSYSYSSYRQFVGLDERLKCMEVSIVFKRFNSIDAIKDFFMKMRNKEFIENIIEVLRQQNEEKKINKIVKKKINIEEYFLLNQSKEELNESIIKASEDGISQAKIGNFLGISQQAVYLRVKKSKQKIGEEK